MMKDQSAESRSDRIRTIYLFDEERDALAAIAEMQGTSTSSVLRRIFEEYLAGKFTPANIKPRKTSMWIGIREWESVREKAASEGFSIRAIVAAGLERMRGKR